MWQKLGSCRNKSTSVGGAGAVTQTSLSIFSSLLFKCSQPGGAWGFSPQQRSLLRCRKREKPRMDLLGEEGRADNNQPRWEMLLQSPQLPKKKSLFKEFGALTSFDLGLASTLWNSQIYLQSRGSSQNCWSHQLLLVSSLYMARCNCRAERAGPAALWWRKVQREKNRKTIKNFFKKYN